MSKNTSTKELTLNVKNYGTDHSVLKQYGMRYPDGTVRWGEDKIAAGDYALSFDSIIQRKDNADQHWADRLKKRAFAAQIDPDDYAAEHQALVRTVIVVITEAEEL